MKKNIQYLYFLPVVPAFKTLWYTLLYQGLDCGQYSFTKKILDYLVFEE